MGEYFRDQMHKVIEKNHPKAVNEIRGLGMINGIQLNHPSGQPVVDLCFQDNKVLINNTNGNVLRFVPPLITGKEGDRPVHQGGRRRHDQARLVKRNGVIAKPKG